MTTCIEYGVTLTDGQKSKLLRAIQNKSPLTLRLKHSNLQGTDELICERFERRSHFKSRLSLIVRVNVVLNRTVVVDSD